MSGISVCVCVGIIAIRIVWRRGHVIVFMCGQAIVENHSCALSFWRFVRCTHLHQHLCVLVCSKNDAFCFLAAHTHKQNGRSECNSVVRRQPNVGGRWFSASVAQSTERSNYTYHIRRRLSVHMASVCSGMMDGLRCASMR